jgi:hypothetical protein
MASSDQGRKGGVVPSKVAARALFGKVRRNSHDLAGKVSHAFGHIKPT